MRHRLLVLGLAVGAVLMIAVAAAPVGATGRLLAAHLVPAQDHPSVASAAALPTPATVRSAPSTGPRASARERGRSRPHASRGDRESPKTRAATHRGQQEPRRGSRSAGSRGTVHLTFDDGPGPATLPILSVLERTGSTATFFQLGRNVRGQQAVQRAIRAQGSNLGNHTVNHPDLTTLGPSALRDEIAGGVPSRCVRPPYGATNAAVRRAVRAAGAREVLWSVDTRDWARPGVAALERTGRSAAVEDGAIILMHDGGGDRRQTIAALPGLIAHLQARGYAVRALPSC